MCIGVATPHSWRTDSWNGGGVSYLE